MIERCQEPGFPLEPRQPLAIGQERVGKNLDRDLATEALVSRAIDFAHAAGAKRRDDFIRSEMGSAS